MFGFGKTPEEKFITAVIKLVVKACNRPIVDYAMAEAFVNDHKSMFLRFYSNNDTPELALHMAALSCCDNLMGITADTDGASCPLSDGIIVDIFKWSLDAFYRNDPEGNGTKLFLDKAEELERFLETNNEF